MQNEKIEDLMGQIGHLTVNDLLALTETLKKKYDLDLSNGFMPTLVDTTKVEKKTFKVSVESIGENKIAVIKAVKEIKGLGLKESKDFVDTIVGRVETFDDEIEAQAVFNTYQKIGLVVSMIEVD